MKIITLAIPLRIAACALCGALIAPRFLDCSHGPGSGDAVAASTALVLDTPGLVAGADRILRGLVLGRRAIEQVDGTIDTEYELAVEQDLLGSAEGTVRVRLPGGVLPDGRGMLLSGVEHAPLGARVLWFLGPPGSYERCMPVGLAQGLWRLIPTADGGSLALRGGSGLALLDAEGLEARGSSQVVRPFAELLAEIHAAVAAREVSK